MRSIVLAALAAGAALTAGPAGSQSFEQVPGGSWQLSCRDITVQRGELTARCMDRRGGLQITSLRYRECRREITNEDGRLSCGERGPGGGYGGPGGGYGGGRGRIVLFEHSDYRGRSIEIDRDTPDLSPMGFSDIASSARVQGGAWEVCENINYQGRCARVNGDLSDFTAIALSDRVSSVRKVR